VADTHFPDRAALVLGSSSSGEDGLLQVREIRDLELRADLVTLSACDTGNGKLLGQEGIASLERAFLLAGAKAVIASLWTADDTSKFAQGTQVQLTATPPAGLQFVNWAGACSGSNPTCTVDNQRYFGASGIQQVIGSRDDDLLGSLIRNMLQGPQLLNGKI